MRSLLKLAAVVLAYVLVISAILTGCSGEMQHFGVDADAEVLDDAGAPVRGHPDAGAPDVLPDMFVDEPVQLRPLGAGCIEAPQCESGVCTRGMCCDRPDDVCNVCVGGYVTPLSDDTVCGAGMCHANGTIENSRCLAGVCVPREVDCCKACGAQVNTAGCYVQGDGVAACGCFAPAGMYCKE